MRIFIIILTFIFQINFASAQSYSEGVRLYKQKQYLEAAEIFKKLSNEGDSKAQARLGFMYYKGLGVTKDFENAVKYYKLAEKKNNRVAITNLGWMYQRGWGVTKDLNLSSKLYLRAAKMNYGPAQNKIADFYRYL